MSETFVIKKTAFDDAGIFSEKEANSFVIGPGELNGPAGLSRQSDLRLFGFGSLKWGEGIDQNLYHILENFACPRKTGTGVAGSPISDILTAGSPIVYYDESIHPVMPKDENDLGIGNGITTPVVGQFWYDTTSRTLFIYKEYDYPVPTPSNFYWETVGIDPGTIRIDAKTTMSVNDLECNGQLVNKFKYAALFEEISYTYGGSGDNFAVPTIAALDAGSPVTTPLIYVIRT